MDLGLDGRVALVCGSSSGLGLAIARALAQEGARVALNGRDTARLHAARDTFPAGSAEAFPADVAEPAQAHALVDEVVRRMGRLDILLCNAGGPPATSFADAPAEAWTDAIARNLMSAVQLCRAAVPHMRARGWGRILCLTSVAAKQPLSGLILSTTARAGVLGFAKTLADEVARDGITVNVLCPGYFSTDRVGDLARERAALSGRTPEEVLAATTAAIPVGRMGDPAELAAVAAFLASEGAAYVTGTALSVDGGVTRTIL